MEFNPVLAKIGRPRASLETTTSVSIAVPKDVERRLTALAAALGATRSSIVRGAIVALIEQAEAEGILKPVRAKRAPKPASKA